MHFITHCVLTEVARDNKDDNSLGVTPHIKPGDNLDELDSKVITETCIPTLGVKIRNLKVDFKTGGTWRRVRQ